MLWRYACNIKIRFLTEYEFMFIYVTSIADSNKTYLHIIIVKYT